MKRSRAAEGHSCPGHLWSKTSLYKSCRELQQHGWDQPHRDHRKAVADLCPSAKWTRASQQPCTNTGQLWTQGRVEDETGKTAVTDLPAKANSNRDSPRQAKRQVYQVDCTALPLGDDSPVFSVLTSTPWWRWPSFTLHELDLSLVITWSLFIHHFSRERS